MMSRLIGRRFKYYEYQNSKRHTDSYEDEVTMLKFFKQMAA